MISKRHKILNLILVFMNIKLISVLPGFYYFFIIFELFRITCTKCIDCFIYNCEICPTERHKTWSDTDNIEPLEEFTKWILKAFDKEYKTLIFAHYGSKFDHHFVLQRLYKFGIAPRHLLMSGCKIYEFTVKAGKAYSTLTFRDSYLLMSVKLAELKKTFSLKAENKLYFPHL